jgi:hypothetical protein
MTHEQGQAAATNDGEQDYQKKLAKNFSCRTITAKAI